MGAQEDLRAKSAVRVFVAVLAALLLGSSTFLAAPASAAPVYPASGGGIDWGVKASFRNYILNGPAEGSISVDGGATTNPDGTFHFPVASGTTYDQGTGSLTASFGGAVHFSGHDGLLELHISDLRLVQTTTVEAELYADVVSRPLPTQAEPNPEPVTYSDVLLADLGIIDVQTTNPVTFEIDAALADGGAAAFEGFYEAGEVLDDVRGSLRLADGVAPTVGLSWRISEYAFTTSAGASGQGGLVPAHANASPALKVPGTPGGAFVWPDAVGVRFNPATGALRATFPGDVLLGNFSQGAYRIRFADLEVIVRPGGSGELLADVQFGLCTEPDGDAGNPCPAVPVPGGNNVIFQPVATDVQIATFSGASITTTGSNLSFTVTPDFVVRTDNPTNPLWRRFPQALLNALPASLHGHFQETGSATQDANKPPAPLTVNIPFPTRTADERYVEQLYVNLLDRRPDAAGLAYWVGRLAAVGPQQLVTELLRLPEPANQIVNAVYGQYLGRGPDAAGRAFWIGRIVGGDTVESIERFFLTSAEATTGVSNADYVAYLYDAILRRTAGTAEAEAWVAALDGGATKLSVVNAILGSRESAELRVLLVYLAILDRGPDAAGLDYWADAFQAEGSRLALLTQLASSGEYRSVLAPALRPEGPRLPVAFPPAA